FCWKQQWRRSGDRSNAAETDAAADTVSGFDHLEFAFRRATKRTDPVIGNISPARARCDSFIRQPFRLVIDEAAGRAKPSLVIAHPHLPIVSPSIITDSNGRRRAFQPSPPPS